MISGLTLDASLDSLARLYYRTAVAIALGTRHILDALNAKGYAISHLHLTGGHTKNPLLLELYADTTGCTVVQPAEEDAVLLGTAMVAATAAGLFPDLPAAAAAMARDGRGAPSRTRPRRAGLRPRLPGVPRDARAAPRAGADRVDRASVVLELRDVAGWSGRP